MSSYQKRRISEQTYKFPKCIFSIFSFSIHDIYLFCIRCRSAGAPLLLEHKIFPEMLCVVFVGWKMSEERGRKKRKMKRGRLGKAKENQYVSDKKAQILDASSV